MVPFPEQPNTPVTPWHLPISTSNSTVRRAAFQRVRFQSLKLGNSIAGLIGGGVGAQIIGALGGGGAGGLHIGSIIGQIASGGVGRGILMVIVGLIKSRLWVVRRPPE